MKHFHWIVVLVVVVLFLVVLTPSADAFPVESSPESDTFLPSQHAHHHHHKHHIRHKHRRRSLTSEEDAKTQRNKQIMLTKPYWPWP